MNIADLIKISWRALLRNKTRALLTMLGIIIGIGSVIGMVSIGQSSSQSINDQISEMGTNLIMVMRKAERSGGVNIGSDSVQTMRASDADAILAGSKNVIMASPMVASAGQIVYGSQNWPGSIQGGNSSYLAINKRNISSGANFTENDVKQAAKVCLIGTTVRDNIFPNGENPLGKIIRFGKIPMKIIGVLESKGQNQMGQDQDDIVIAPYTTVQKRMLAVNYVHMIFASAASEDVAYAAVSDIENILRKEHRIKAGKDNDFEVRTQQQILEIMGSITGILTLLLTAVAAISLLVGGIGIMNIMYVTVTERTREIGLRMAVGGKNSDILMQFLAESTILSLAGGIIGIFLGVGLAFGASYALNWPFIVSLGSVAISFLVCALIGIFFGWYPARKAANLDPINALRYE
ncbi:MAG: ABC transporter permease [Bacteroidetes bacterium]|uniref:ABC transporter permease n=1 Tax=Candidatus Caccoplasma merdipullorum TaxID=2840718 RepID=A0A9D9H7M4_9BACT|nr:ABC transporter permease [Candidatus Caccoplasma merdipullorum]